ncbi:MAG: carboxylating nicotinate-nucleotide diphosphorylase [Euryarchaeota archaeon]|nr:carboxylating nicotinate-nucleotide diphosphorylase [Euryarchaeota archaeon]
MKQALLQMIYDDIGFEDVTTNALISPDLKIDGKIISKERGIIAGVDMVNIIFNEFNIETSLKKRDGDAVEADDVVMEINGNARSILSVERTVLNFLMRMSGIATLTSKMVENTREVNRKVIIAGTRKTTPGIQFFEKNAIKVGGGDTHRYRLDDCVLIKDNHIAIVGSVSEAIKKAKESVSFTKKIEVEVEILNDAISAAKTGADIIMLDNMAPEEIRKVLKALENENLRDKILVEASGRITLDNVLEYAKTGVDILSSGYITHSARALDMSLEI